MNEKEEKIAAGKGAEEAVKETEVNGKKKVDPAALWSGGIINKQWVENYQKKSMGGKVGMLASVLLLMALAVLCVLTFIVMFRVKH